MNHVRRWIGLGLLLIVIAAPSEAADLAEVLSMLDEPGARWDPMVAPLRAEGDEGLARLMALRRILETKTDGDQIEARLAAHARLDRLDDLIDRVANQPHAAASELFWYDELEEARDAARRLHRPILTLHLAEGADDVHRLCALVFFTGPTAEMLRERFVLCTQALSDARRAPVFLILDASGRPTHAHRGFCTQEVFARWLVDGQELATEVYQNGDDHAQAAIAAAHGEWGERGLPAEEEAELPFETKLLFTREPPWFEPGEPERELSRAEELLDFVQASHEASLAAEIHDLFREGIFTRSSHVLAQKVAGM